MVRIESKRFFLQFSIALQLKQLNLVFLALLALLIALHCTLLPHLLLPCALAQAQSVLGHQPQTRHVFHADHVLGPRLQT